MLGQTLSKLLAYALFKTHDPSKLTSSIMKKSLKYWPVPYDQEWQIPLMKELYGVLQGSGRIPGFSNEECQQLLKHICVD